MYKKMASLLVILLIGGCASKVDFTQGVSEEDKKLLSSYEDKLLSIKHGIRITENGFSPKYDIPKKPFKKLDNKNAYESKYSSRIVRYLDIRKFNLKKFMVDVNKYNLKSLRIKLLAIKKRYPSVTLIKANKTEIKNIFSSSISQDEIDKILVKSTPSYLTKILNPSKELTQIALNSRKANCVGMWNNNTRSCWSHSRLESHNASIEANIERNRKLNSSTYSGSGGSSSGGGNSGCRIQTVHVSGGNGRTTQTTICN